MKQKVLITSALPYANGPLHFGHIAGAYLPGDCYARFQRLMGRDVLYICGSDEYGVAITLSAESAGRTPKAHVDLFHEINKNFFSQLGFSFDHYSRTTWAGHIKTTQQFFLDLLNNGHIEERVTDQLYSEKEARFFADRYVVGTCPKCSYPEARGDECQKCGASYEATDLISPRSKVSGAPLIRKPTKNWFLRFDHFKERLSEWIDQKHWKANVVNFAKGYIEDLKPRAITRDSDWGVPIPLPGTEGKVLYVWFDAPIGYISATREWAEKIGRPEAWKDYWLEPETKLVQFIGKDNIPFHAVFFPAMTMGQNVPYKLVDELPANEFYTLDGRQFSKSDGWTIDLDAFFERFSADQIRFAIAANAPENQDSEFSWKDFQLRCNSELLGKYGNLINRTLVFVQSQCDGKVPASSNLHPIDQEFLQKVSLLTQAAQEAYSTFHLRKACQLIMELAQAGNVYFDAKKPWIAAKSALTHHDMQNTIACCLEGIKALALISAPVIPGAAEKVWRMLGFNDTLAHQNWEKVATHTLVAGLVLPKPEVLFARVEDEVIQSEIEKLQKLKTVLPAEMPKAAQPIKKQVGIEEFRKLDLRTGKILHAERVPKSKKMLKITVDLGFEKRTIASGIGDKFDDLADLIGCTVVIVANLKPAVLMGIESQGMILAAETPFGLELPQFKEALPGIPVA
ncbi:MAG: methionine--tRNA ligase [Rhabdochlamydiaceae bacterium]|nr:methionine--tRNA ligase [Rhabdochlamydiaceae bacterium]